MVMTHGADGLKRNPGEEREKLGKMKGIGRERDFLTESYCYWGLVFCSPSTTCLIPGRRGPLLDDVTKSKTLPTTPASSPELKVPLCYTVKECITAVPTAQGLALSGAQRLHVSSHAGSSVKVAASSVGVCDQDQVLAPTRGHAVATTTGRRREGDPSALRNPIPMIPNALFPFSCLASIQLFYEAKTSFPCSRKSSKVMS
ncbi:hypothetical protein EJ110_NYTH33123 [Nymphaea thermarum]|nr:hypothetical protein EJ110_NYTH33123 [Nymphaea thermarum]